MEFSSSKMGAKKPQCTVLHQELLASPSYCEVINRKTKQSSSPWGDPPQSAIRKYSGYPCRTSQTITTSSRSLHRQQAV